MKLFRREFLHLIPGCRGRRGFPPGLGTGAPQHVQVATGLLATWQSTAWLGAEAGLFRKRGVDLTLPAIAVGGPQAASGLISGNWEFAHTGTLPVAEEILKGNDIVDSGNAHIGVLQLVYHDKEGDHSAGTVGRERKSAY